MKVFLIIVGGLLSLCFLGGLLFICIGFPIWAIIDCAMSKQKSAGSKTLWIVLIFLTSVIGVVIYSFFGSEGKALRRASMYVSAVVILGIVGIILMSNFYSSEVTRGINQYIVQLKTLDTGDLKPEEVQALESNLLTLSGETKSNFMVRDELSITGLFLQYFALIARDRKIDQQEYQSWSQKFELRKTFKSNEFEDFVRKQSVGN